MKATERQSKGTSGYCTKVGLGCTTSESMKPTSQRRKTKGRNSFTAVSAGLQVSPIHSSTAQIQVQSSIEAMAPCGPKLVQGKSQQCFKKVKLQLFPINEVTKKGLEEGNFNPYLELTLPTRKKISSVVKHLNVKWGSSKLALGEFMLFPYDAHLDNLANHRRWTLKDSDTTAADVHAFLGSPANFRLRYGWFPNIEPTSSFIVPVTSVRPEDGLNPNKNGDMNVNCVTKLQCPVSEKEKGPACLDNPFSSEFGRAFQSDKSVQNETDRSICKNNLSWIDCLSNMSFGALLSEVSQASNANHCHLLAAQRNSTFQQSQDICDSFDAAIAGFIDRHQPTNQSVQGGPSSVNICQLMPGEKYSTSQQIPVSCDSFDAAIAALVACHQPTNQLAQIPLSSIWDAEVTCHPFPSTAITSSSQKLPVLSEDASVKPIPSNAENFSTSPAALNNNIVTQMKQSSINGICQVSETNLELYQINDDLEECAPCMKPHSLDDVSKELKAGLQSQAEASDDNSNQTESLCPLDHVAPCSKDMSSGDTIGIGGQIASSMDAFQNFSIF